MEMTNCDHECCAKTVKNLIDRNIASRAQAKRDKAATDFFEAWKIIAASDVENRIRHMNECIFKAYEGDPNGDNDVETLNVDLRTYLNDIINNWKTPDCDLNACIQEHHYRIVKMGLIIDSVFPNKDGWHCGDRTISIYKST